MRETLPPPAVVWTRVIVGSVGKDVIVAPDMYLSVADLHSTEKDLAIAVLLAKPLGCVFQNNLVR